MDARATTVTSIHSPSVMETWLTSRQRTVVRVAWLAAAITALTLLVVNIPSRYDQLATLTPATGSGHAQSRISAEVYAHSIVGLEVLLGLSWFAVAVVIVRHRPADRLALLTSFMLVSFLVSFTPAETADRHPALATPISILSFVSWVLLGLFCYLFPDGRFVPHRLRAWIIPFVAIQALMSFSWLPFSTHRWPASLHTVLTLGLWGSYVFAQLYRYRKVSGPVERQQAKWLLFGLTGIVSVFGSYLLLSLFVPTITWPGSSPDLAFRALSFVGFMLIPVSIAIAILRYRLWDIDLLINRTLVYSALTVMVVGLYVVVVGYLGAVFATGDHLAFSLVATSIVAVLFQPAKERLQRAVNQLMYGVRDDPYAVLTRLGQRLEATLAPEAILPTVVETVAQALKLPYAAIALEEGNELVPNAAYGVPTGEIVTMPLIAQSAVIGQLQLAPRVPGEPFSLADRGLLEGIAAQAAIAAHAVQLTADLQRSRERLVSTREEERRRLRRDLHDGLGPALASLTLKLDAARNQLVRNPTVTDTLLADAKAQTQSAIADIRRLIYNLRPPALDDLGLVAAIRQHAEHLNFALGADGLRVSIDAPASLPPLPAAVEVAAYRIALEALTNVARHAGAHQCVIRFWPEDANLKVEITDDGGGLPHHHRPGVGIHSMRERAEELGGTCLIERLPGSGTRVEVRLPFTVNATLEEG